MKKFIEYPTYIRMQSDIASGISCKSGITNEEIAIQAKGLVDQILKVNETEIRKADRRTVKKVESKTKKLATKKKKV